MGLNTVLGKGAAVLANGLWNGMQWINRKYPGEPLRPEWAPGPLQRNSERTEPPLGFPRETDSLCPDCTREVRKKILDGDLDWRVLSEKKPGHLKAQILERDGKIFIEKTCPKHGAFTDILSIDSAFLKRMEAMSDKRDYERPAESIGDHGMSTIKYGRGAVLTVDLTNRCNMMCEPCFADANQVGYVYEGEWDEIKKILDHSIQIKPRRQMSVQFSGGEPTISPYFLDAVSYARKLGYGCTQTATNGIRFAQSIEFCEKAKEAGLRLAYLQFDGTTNEANSHRGVGNLFEVKKKAIENLHKVGIDVTLVVTVVNTVNNDQVGPVLRFAIENVGKVNCISFQPVSFCGRDEEIDDETRANQRYTLTHLVKDLESQTGVTRMLRDWYPLNAAGPFSDMRDHLTAAESNFGTLKCGCHPNCGIGTMILVNTETKDAVPIPAVMNTDQVLKDFRSICDAHRGRTWTVAQSVLSIIRNWRYGEVPSSIRVKDMIRVMDGYNGKFLGIADRHRYDWRILLVAGMWFQDLWTYDFRRTEQCVIPYGTPLGEISFCAYNTGHGWREVIESKFRKASLADWYKARGRHKVYAGGKKVPLEDGGGEKVTPAEPVEVPAASVAVGADSPS